MNRRRVLHVALGSALLPSLRPLTARAGETSSAIVVAWNAAALQAIRTTRPGPPMAARALAVVHTCIYDAWAAYDSVAVGTRYGGDLRRPAWERTLENKAEAISFAAYRALSDLYPTEVAQFANLMVQLGYDPTDTSTDVQRPAGIGNVAAQAVLEYRHQDGSNQLGERRNSAYPFYGAYADYTDYAPVNDYDRLDDPNRWQPLRTLDWRGGLVTQQYVAPHWGSVVPFALSNGTQLRPGEGPPMYPSPAYRERADQLLEFSARLTDAHKMIVEYWADGPGSELPPGHWCLFAQYVSHRDGHDLDADVTLFFILANAIFDAGIAAWDCKRAVDYVRPITAIRFLNQGKQVRAWGGPGKGSQLIDGGTWLPYQSPIVVTPPFPEFISGHSTFSAAAAEVLKRFTGSDALGTSYTVPAGRSRLEPGVTPTQDVTLSWDTFTDAADQAGLSRRYGGIHFQDGDLLGRAMGRQVGALVWDKAQAYIRGAT